jgi:hypothetical protein
MCRVFLFSEEQSRGENSPQDGQTQLQIGETKMRGDHNSPQEENSLVPQSDETQALVQKGIEIEQPDSEEAESEQEQTPQVIVEKRERTSIVIVTT